jgi:hypothetical protein
MNMPFQEIKVLLPENGVLMPKRVAVMPVLLYFI